MCPKHTDCLRLCRADAPRILAQFVYLLPKEQLNEKDRWGWSPLHVLANNNVEGVRKAAMIHQIVEAGGDVNILGNRGATPLLKASSTGAMEQVRLLMQIGADPDLPDETGATPWDNAWHNRALANYLNSVQAAPGKGVSGKGRRQLGRSGAGVHRRRACDIDRRKACKSVLAPQKIRFERCPSKSESESFDRKSEFESWPRKSEFEILPRKSRFEDLARKSCFEV